MFMVKVLKLKKGKRIAVLGRFGKGKGRLKTGFCRNGNNVSDGLEGKGLRRRIKAAADTADYALIACGWA
ncbi:hypothetical protein LVJ85_07165 [Neisseria sp. Dent CA1/247]|uniref:hypothetical protein n=1 Tax=Neisseria sp. Dent CA1/247 TaxID=2912675 RepID=UPI001FD5F196|nr:hypothetical protein [Neisseria sp. Dent CA1/247]UOO75842.1 hypothetical protein LVJ85_07165 [Neisseria sp. Dent CA1/247]